MGNKPSIQDTVFNLKLKSKELERASKKCEKDEKTEKSKVKKAIEKGNKEGARIYAQNAIRKKHEALNYLKLSAKMDAVASRLDAADKSQSLSQDIAKTVPQLEKALKDMSVEQIATNTESFEKLFEDLDVRSEFIANAVDSTTATSTPVDQVDQLIAQVADEHALDVGELLNDAPIGEGAVAAAAQPTAAARADPIDPLAERLNNLKT